MYKLLKPYHRIIIINIPRSYFKQQQSNNNSFPYDALEELKDGKIISEKYNVEEISFDYTPHIIIMSNNLPDDIEKLSKDRWNIY